MSELDASGPGAERPVTEAPAPQGPGAAEGHPQGTWWYRYPDGTWVWWSTEGSRWVRLEAPAVTTARTPRWVWLVILIALVLTVLGGVIAVREFPGYLEKEFERIEQQQETRV